MGHIDETEPTAGASAGHATVSTSVNAASYAGAGHMTRVARLLRLVRLGEARPDLPSSTLFHAGPPFRGEPPEAVATAAAQAAVISAMASDLRSAQEQISAGRILLRPAQDYGIAVPLAQVVSPSMWCFEVGDDEYRAYAPVSEGPPPALRFGSNDPGCVDRARVWCSRVAEAINPLVTQLPEPASMMRSALEGGDDCHAVTAAGNALVVKRLSGIDPQLATDILANPGFVLGLWMAWSAWKVRVSGGAITAIGGNGNEFGWRFRNELHWRVVRAETPVGFYFQPEKTHLSLGAIGDSALIDICGFGGQAIAHAPILLKEWASALPPDVLSLRMRIVDPVSGLVDLERVRSSGTAPLIHLAILNRAGDGAPLGRGFYRPPIGLFQQGDW